MTTIIPKTPDHRPDLVQRDFCAQAPGRLWAADITYVRTLPGFAYTAFVVDVYSRKIVGDATRSTMRTDALPMEALDHALTTAGRIHGNQLIHHSDRGSQYVSWEYSTALAESGIRPSVGTVGDSYDNALAETVNGLYKAELIHAQGPWTSVGGKSNWPPCGGCIGGTLSGFTKRWTTPPHKKSKPSTILPSPSAQGRKGSGTKPRTLQKGARLRHALQN